MAKTAGKKKVKFFWIFMLLYVIAGLAAIGYGLKHFWSFIEAYELSRPQHAIDGYIEQLTHEHICDLSVDIIELYDLNIQSEEDCRGYLMSQLGEISYSKNTSETNEQQMVYVLRSGPRVIGEVIMTPQRTDEYGFTYWAVTEETFDLSYLITENSIEITVPEEFTVSVNGAVLDESYLVTTGIQYDVMEEFYGSYDLPTMVTYQAGPFLGDMAFTVTDPDGNTVVIDETTDYNQFVINNCDEQTAEDLSDFVDVYIQHLVAFTGSNRTNGSQNYQNLRAYLVKGGDLDERMQSALATLLYSHNQSDVLAQITLNHCIDIGNGRYLCDVTYLVDTTGLEGVVQTTNNVKIIVVETEEGLRAEAMTSY